MLCYCPISGTNWRTDDFTGKWKDVLQIPHPIFSAPADHLFQRTGDFYSEKLTKVESRRLFLALLNSTELVTWKCAAEPSHDTVLLNFEGLVRFIAWYSNYHRANLRLPRFVVEHSTRELPAMSGWLDAWFAAKTSYEQSVVARQSLEKEWEQQEEVSLKERAISKMIASNITKGGHYVSRLASWAMEAGSVPEGLRELWTSYFKLQGTAIFEARNHDLRELLDHMEAAIDVYQAPILAGHVLTHLRKLVSTYEGGFERWIDDKYFSVDTSTGKIFKILDEDTQRAEEADKLHNSSVLSEGPPPPLEAASNYPSRIAYLRAKARLEQWQSALREQSTSSMSSLSSLSGDTL